jgi:D-alanyl-D-alanine carboxypeptidase/D-alanyl-D-alanine-endopeptidase (penicillin-binding protein 4)
MSFRNSTIAVAIAATAACHASTGSRRPAGPPSPQGTAVGQLQHSLESILNDPPLAHGTWGMLVQSLKSGETLFAWNPQKLLLPASNMKLVTLAAAASHLGWDYTYRTTLLANGSISGGVLAGDLIVVGSGDPSIGASPDTLGAWAEQIKARGIRAITGRVIGDDNAFEDEGLGFGWSWDDLPDEYAAGVSALQYNESTVRLTIVPGPRAGDWAGVSLQPGDSGLTVDSSLTTSASGTPASIIAKRLPGSSRVEARGTVPLAGTPMTRLLSVDNPTQFFVSAFRAALIAHGVDVRGPAVDVDDIRDPPARSDTAAIVHRSAPLSTLALRLMKDSQNLYAETFLKTMSAGRPATAAAGLAAAQATLQTWGVSPDSLIYRDGSGLSRYDYVTAQALVTVLTHVERQPTLKGPFEASLPIAGRDGSLASRMKGTPAEGKARAKTGSMSNVRSLSGLVTAADGEELVFSILANNFETPPATITGAADAIVVRLAQFRRK